MMQTTCPCTASKRISMRACGHCWTAGRKSRRSSASSSHGTEFSPLAPSAFRQTGQRRTSRRSPPRCRPVGQPSPQAACHRSKRRSGALGRGLCLRLAATRPLQKKSLLVWQSRISRQCSALTPGALVAATVPATMAAIGTTALLAQGPLLAKASTRATMTATTAVRMGATIGTTVLFAQRPPLAVLYAQRPPLAKASTRPTNAITSNW
mmetsp:Transcript_60851/g.185773  ORF Transcript_60851/g.185773 Transcript_60851/m.185773 type:complete len:209 (-) Transcript_60851:307-933(-)